MRRGKTLVARVACICTHCERQIEVGEAYYWTRITPWDHVENDGFFTVREHVECARFWDDSAGDLSDNMLWGEPVEWIEEMAAWRVRFPPT